jgi:hypothetical protein
MDKDNTKPADVAKGFLQDATGKSNVAQHAKPTAGRASSAASVLGGAERSATGNAPASPFTKSGAASSEAAPFRSSVSGGIAGGPAGAAGKLAGTLTGKQKSKRGPIAVLLFILFGVGGGAFFAQISSVVAIPERLGQEFETSHISSSRRYTRFLAAQLNSDFRGVGKDFLIFGKAKFRPTKTQISRWESQGITMVDSDGHRWLSYEGKAIVANAKDADWLSKNRGISDAATLSDAMYFDKGPSGFKNAFDKSSARMRRRAGLMFDTTTSKVKGWTRNRFKSNPTDADKIQETAKEHKAITEGSAEEVKSTNQDGEETTTTRQGADADDINVKSGDTPETIGAKVEKRITSMASAQKITGGVASVANGVCAAMTVSASINILIAAQEVAKISNFASGLLETLDAPKAGKGSPERISYYMGLLNGSDGKSSASQSYGFQALFSGTAINNNDPSVQKFNLEDSARRVMGGFGAAVGDYMGCVYARVGAAIANIALTFTGGGKVGSMILGVVAGAALQTGLAAAIQAIIPGIVEKYTLDLLSDATGLERGDALVAATHRYLGNSHQLGGGSPGSAEAVAEFKREQSQVLAEEAALDRANRSPFDVTSQNTFLGSIMYALTPMSISLSAGSLLSSLGSLVTTSATNLLPSANAIGETALVSSFGDCPFLQSTGAVCDAYGNPYMVSDLTTMDASPDDLYDKVASLDPANFDGETSEGNPIIKPDSDLGRYVKYCSGRESQFGVVDANITADFQTPGSFWDVVPIIGDVIEIGNATLEAANVGWSTGQNCIASTKNPDWDSKYKYYQRYLEDQRLMEAAGIVNQSAAIAVLDQYEADHPINSYEDMLAHMTGMTKDQVLATLDEIDEQNFVATYDPADYGPAQVATPVPLSETFRHVTIASHAYDNPLPANAFDFGSTLRSRTVTV